MTSKPCPHETDVVAAVLGRRWPEGCDESLRTHAAACEVCREVVEVAALLREEYDEARDAISRRDVPLPSAGQIWWRAAVKARVEAAEAATRPLVWGYGVAAACAVALLIAGGSVLWPSLLPAWDRLSLFADWVPAMPQVASATSAVVVALRAQLPIVISVGVFLVAVPVALYFALREE